MQNRNTLQLDCDVSVFLKVFKMINLSEKNHLLIFHLCIGISERALIESWFHAPESRGLLVSIS